MERSIPRKSSKMKCPAAELRGIKNFPPPLSLTLSLQSLRLETEGEGIVDLSSKQYLGKGKVQTVEPLIATRLWQARALTFHMTSFYVSRFILPDRPS
jgi:hypothetical protein